MKTKASEFMEKLTLIQEMNGDNTMKAFGTDIPFATPADELARYIISEIPNLYRMAKISSNEKGLSEEDRNKLCEDAQSYLSQFDTLVEIYLNESELRCLTSS